MSKISSKIFKSNSHGQQVHEKGLDITNHQGNANQNHNQTPFHTSQDSFIKKTKGNVGKCIDKGGTLYPVGGNINRYSQYAKECGGSLKSQKWNCLMTQQLSCWVYMRRKGKLYLTELSARPCSWQHELQEPKYVNNLTVH